MIVLDTSVLVEALSGARPLAIAFGNVLETGERIRVPAVVLYAWLRGPRALPELAVQRLLFPDERALPFGPAEARVAADLYQVLPRAEERVDTIAIAACALARDAQLWTARTADFADIPGLTLFRPPPDEPDEPDDEPDGEGG